MEGNVQKMRETLLVVRDALDTISAHEDDIEFVRVWIAQTKDAVQKVLSAPPRNCDRFNNEREMQFAFLAELLSMGINGASLEEYSKWLLAEAKGASNESK